MKVERFNESLDEGKPEIGDFVICTDETGGLNSIIHDMIGEIIDYVDTFGAQYPYIIKYDLDPQLLKDLEMFTSKINKEAFPFSIKEINHFSRNKKDLILILQTNKFNL